MKLERHATDRQVVMDLAESAWQKNDFKTISIATIAAESGLSNGAIYFQFPSIEELKLALMARAWNQVLWASKSLLRVQTKAKGAAQIEALLQKIASFPQKHRVIIQSEIHLAEARDNPQMAGSVYFRRILESRRQFNRLLKQLIFLGKYDKSIIDSVDVLPVYQLLFQIPVEELKIEARITIIMAASQGQPIENDSHQKYYLSLLNSDIAA